MQFWTGPGEYPGYIEHQRQLANVALANMRRKEAALHEAAHTIVASSVGARCVALRLEDGLSGGGALTADLRGIGPRDRASIYAAGGLGAAMAGLTPEADALTFDAGNIRDLGLGPDALADATRRAAGILRSRWADVERIAARLLRDGSLDARALADALGPAPTSSTPWPIPRR